MLSTLKEILDKCKQTLFIEDEEIGASIKIDEHFLTVQFTTGEQVVLSRENLRNKWDALKTEITNFERNQESGGIGENDSKDVIETKEKRQVEVKEIHDRSNDNCMTVDNSDQIMGKTGVDVVQTSFSSVNKLAREPDEVNVNPSNDVTMRNDDQQATLSLDDLNNKYKLLQKMIDHTVNMHQKMKEDLETQKRQREKDFEDLERAKKPKISSIEVLPPDTRILRNYTNTRTYLPVKNNYSNDVHDNKNLNDGKNNSNESLASQIKETIKIELVNKDNSTKRDYKLTREVSQLSGTDLVLHEICC